MGLACFVRPCFTLTYTRTRTHTLSLPPFCLVVLVGRLTPKQPSSQHLYERTKVLAFFFVSPSLFPSPPSSLPSLCCWADFIFFFPVFFFFGAFALLVGARVCVCACACARCELCVVRCELCICLPLLIPPFLCFFFFFFFFFANRRLLFQSKEAHPSTTTTNKGSQR